jgi:hypothetical protein
MAVAKDSRSLYCLDNPTQYMTSPINGVAKAVLSIFATAATDPLGTWVAIPQDHPTFGWDILPDPSCLSTDRRSKIRFRLPVYSRSLLIRVSYPTTAPYCSKCGGTSKLIDFSPGVSGSLVRATGRSKLTLRILKFLLTSKCTFYPSLTCPLRSYTGRRFGSTLTSEDISAVVGAAMANLQAVQALQAKYQTLDSGEILTAVTGVSSARDTSDPRMVNVAVAVSSPAGAAFQLNVGLKAPV